MFCFNKWGEPCDMSERTFLKILQILPFANEAGFLFSCKFEPSLHPHFLKFIDLIPKQFKKKVFFTMNLVKYFDDETFHRLANSKINFINISLETFNPTLYEKLTSVKNTHFYENIDRMAMIFNKYPLAPKIRFITMILKDNYDELIDIAKTAHEKYHPSFHEFRTPYFFLHNGIDTLSRQLLNRTELDTKIKQLQELNIDNCYYWAETDLEKYQCFINPPPINIKEKTEEQLKYQKINVDPNSHYLIEIFANGKILFQYKEHFNINDIEDPFLFFSLKTLRFAKTRSRFI